LAASIVSAVTILGMSPSVYDYPSNPAKRRRRLLTDGPDRALLLQGHRLH
jgi:hypothetical protein